MGTLLEQSQQLVVDVPVANPMRKSIDPRSQETLRILERKHVGGHAKTVPMSFLDDRTIQLGRKLLVLTTPIIHPDLDQVDVQRRQFLLTLALLLRLALGFLFLGLALGGFLVIQYGISDLPGSGVVIPRPAVR